MDLAPVPATLDQTLPAVAVQAPAPMPVTFPTAIPVPVAAASISAPPSPIPVSISDGGSLNWFMIIVVCVVALLTIVFCLYMLVIYQHPEDRNQAWFPKIVVLFGMSVAIYTVLMFPLDVTNSQVCDLNLPLVDCSTTFPMEELWQAVYIANMITVFILVPFAFFFYESDSEWNAGKKMLSATLWTVGIVIIVLVIIGIPYIFGGYARYQVQGARSGMLPVADLSTPGLLECIAPTASLPSSTVKYGGSQCLASNGPTETLQVRVSLIVYAMSLVATVGWILLLIFGAIGMVTLPMDWIREFISRPRATISRKQYVERAKDLARRARDIQYVAEGMKRQERESGRSRKWRKNYSALQAQVTVLEDDEAQLQRVYPQGEDPAYSWTITVIMYWVKLLLGVCAVAITITWVLQIILYILIDPPVTPLLNTAFIQANDVFPLFGTILFGIFVFYLQLAVMKGNFKFGLNVFFFRVHPIRKGATVMSSFLFNTSLVLIATTATIQFAATAFALYANNTAIVQIFGNTLRNIDGIKYIYTENIYIYCFVVVMILTLLVLFLRGPDRWKRKKPEDFYRM